MQCALQCRKLLTAKPYSIRFLLTQAVYRSPLTSTKTRSSATAEEQRVSCPHGGRGAKPSSPLPLRWLIMHMVESESHNVRTSSVPSVKRPLKWIGHSRSFKVILIGAGRRTSQQELPSNIYKWFILPQTRVIDLHSCRWLLGSTFISFHVIMLQSRTLWI